VGIVNSVFIFVAFLFTIPGLITPARGWLKLGGWMTTICGMFSLILGLYLWILTLKTKEDFAPLYFAQPPEIQELMQTAVSTISIPLTQNPMTTNSYILTVKTVPVLRLL